MTLLRQNLRYAARSLRREAGFTAVAALTLALGIGGTTAVFSFLNALLLRPLPVHEPARLVWVGGIENGEPVSSFSYPDYLALREGSTGLEALAAFDMSRVRAGVGDAARATVGAFVSDNYFGALGVRPAAGRFFNAAETAPGGPPAVVLGHTYWERAFAADPGIVGRTVHLNGTPFTVVGVAPRGFGGTISLVALDFWAPLSAHPVLFPGRNLNSRGTRSLQLVGRLAPGATREAASGMLSAYARGLPAPAGAPRREMVVEPLGGLNGEGRAGAFGVTALLFATALFVLAIAGANVAGMVLARNALRRGEIGVRLAVGATPRQLAAQLLTESVLLWLVGGAGSLLLVFALGRLFPRLVPTPADFPARLGLDLSVDLRVLAFALALSLATGVAFGLLPALQAVRDGLSGVLKEQAGPGARRSRLRSGLVSAQVALSVLLLVCAGLLLRALREVSAADPGFDPDGVVAARFEPPGAPRPLEAKAAYDALLAQVAARPGVEAVSLASTVPLTGGSAFTRVRAGSAREMDVGYAAVTPEYFRTLRISLVRGRGFTAGDRFGAPPVAVVSETMARRLWPGADPIGQAIRQGPVTLLVVGVAEDVATRGFGRPAEPLMYAAFAQQPSVETTLLVRGGGSGLDGLRDVLRAHEARLGPAQVQAFRDQIVAGLPQRVLAPVLGAFGVLGLLLSAVGVYGLIAYITARRTRELGIRAALGAAPAEIMRIVLAQGVRLVGVGLVAGLLVSLVGARLLSPLLAGRSALDPATFAAVGAVLFAVALAACYLPARRATRVSPVTALRSE
jgi:putative ABC transport system permease protein